MVSYNPPQYISGLKPTVLSYKDQVRVAELIFEGVIKYDISMITFNVLPDHVHALVQVESEEDLALKIGNIKGNIAHVIRKEQAISGRLWARKFHRQLIKDDRHYGNVIDYIDQNHLKHAESWGKDMLCGFGKELKEILGKLPGV